MRNIVKRFLVFLLIFIVLPVFASNIETHYNREGVVIAVYGEEILIEDTTQNVWTFNGKGFAEGDKVKMKMFTNYTDSNIHDDKIKKVEIIH